MKKFNLILIVLLCVHSFSAYSKIVDSRIIKNDNRDKEVFTSRGGMEGWAWVSFLVDVDGKPKDIVTFDYSGKQRYIRDTIAYVNNLTFSPATISGTPVISERKLFLPHTISGIGYSVGSITPAFAKEYQATIDIINTPKNISNVRTLIDNLKDDHTKNLHEHALAAWLESIYYYKTEEFLEYMNQSHIILKLNKYMPLKILSKSVVNLFEVQLHYGYYIEAENTLDSMPEIKGLKLSDQVEAKFRQQLEAKMSSSLPIQVKGKLTTLGGWVYYNKMQKFNITKVNGVINSVELRCLGFHEKYKEGWLDGLVIPSTARECVTLVQGTKGTTFDLIQMQ